MLQGITQTDSTRRKISKMLQGITQIPARTRVFVNKEKTNARSVAFRISHLDVEFKANKSYFEEVKEYTFKRSIKIPGSECVVPSGTRAECVSPSNTHATAAAGFIKLRVSELQYSPFDYILQRLDFLVWSENVRPPGVPTERNRTLRTRSKQIHDNQLALWEEVKAIVTFLASLSLESRVLNMITKRAPGCNRTPIATLLRLLNTLASVSSTKYSEKKRIYFSPDQDMDSAGLGFEANSDICEVVSSILMCLLTIAENRDKHNHPNPVYHPPGTSIRNAELDEVVRQIHVTLNAENSNLLLILRALSNGVEAEKGSYPGTIGVLALLKLIFPHEWRYSRLPIGGACSSFGAAMPGLLNGICTDVFLCYDSWRYRKRAERWEIGILLLQLFNDILSSPDIHKPLRSAIGGSRKESRINNRSSLKARLLEDFQTQGNLRAALVKPIVFGRQFITALKKENNNSSEVEGVEKFVVLSFQVLRKILALARGIPGGEPWKFAQSLMESPITVGGDDAPFSSWLTLREDSAATSLVHCITGYLKVPIFKFETKRAAIDTLTLLAKAGVPKIEFLNSSSSSKSSIWNRQSNERGPMDIVTHFHEDIHEDFGPGPYNNYPNSSSAGRFSLMAYIGTQLQALIRPCIQILGNVDSSSLETPRQKIAILRFLATTLAYQPELAERLVNLKEVNLKEEKKEKKTKDKKGKKITPFSFGLLGPILDIIMDAPGNLEKKQQKKRKSDPNFNEILAYCLEILSGVWASKIYHRVEEVKPTLEDIGTFENTDEKKNKKETETVPNSIIRKIHISELILNHYKNQFWESLHKIYLVKSPGIPRLASVKLNAKPLEQWRQSLGNLENRCRDFCQIMMQKAWVFKILSLELHHSYKLYMKSEGSTDSKHNQKVPGVQQRNALIKHALIKSVQGSSYFDMYHHGDGFKRSRKSCQGNLLSKVFDMSREWELNRISLQHNVNLEALSQREADPEGFLNEKGTSIGVFVTSGCCDSVGRGPKLRRIDWAEQVFIGRHTNAKDMQPTSLEEFKFLLGVSNCNWAVLRARSNLIVAWRMLLESAVRPIPKGEEPSIKEGDGSRLVQWLTSLLKERVHDLSTVDIEACGEFSRAIFLLIRALCPIRDPGGGSPDIGVGWLRNLSVGRYGKPAGKRKRRGRPLAEELDKKIVRMLVVSFCETFRTIFSERLQLLLDQNLRPSLGIDDDSLIPDPRSGREGIVSRNKSLAKELKNMEISEHTEFNKDPSHGLDSSRTVTDVTADDEIERNRVAKSHGVAIGRLLLMGLVVMTQYLKACNAKAAAKAAMRKLDTKEIDDHDSEHGEFKLSTPSLKKMMSVDPTMSRVETPPTMRKLMSLDTSREERDDENLKEEIKKLKLEANVSEALRFTLPLAAKCLKIPGIVEYSIHFLTSLAHPPNPYPLSVGVRIQTLDKMMVLDKVVEQARAEWRSGSLDDEMRDRVRTRMERALSIRRTLNLWEEIQIHGIQHARAASQPDDWKYSQKRADILKAASGRAMEELEAWGREINLLIKLKKIEGELERTSDSVEARTLQQKISKVRQEQEHMGKLRRVASKLKTALQTESKYEYENDAYTQQTVVAAEEYQREFGSDPFSGVSSTEKRSGTIRLLLQLLCKSRNPRVTLGIIQFLTEFSRESTNGAETVLGAGIFALLRDHFVFSGAKDEYPDPSVDLRLSTQENLDAGSSTGLGNGSGRKQNLSKRRRKSDESEVHLRGYLDNGERNLWHVAWCQLLTLIATITRSIKSRSYLNKIALFTKANHRRLLMAVLKVSLKPPRLDVQKEFTFTNVYEDSLPSFRKYGEKGRPRVWRRDWKSFLNMYMKGKANLQELAAKVRENSRMGDTSKVNLDRVTMTLADIDEAEATTRLLYELEQSRTLHTIADISMPRSLRVSITLLLSHLGALLLNPVENLPLAILPVSRDEHSSAGVHKATKKIRSSDAPGSPSSPSGDFLLRSPSAGTPGSGGSPLVSTPNFPSPARSADGRRKRRGRIEEFYECGERVLLQIVKNVVSHIRVITTPNHIRDAPGDRSRMTGEQRGAVERDGGTLLVLGPLFTGDLRNYTEGPHLNGKTIPVHLHILTEIQSICFKKLSKVSKLTKRRLSLTETSNTTNSTESIRRLSETHERVKQTVQLILETTMYIQYRHVKAYVSDGFGSTATVAVKILDEYRREMYELSRRLKDFLKGLGSASRMPFHASPDIPDEYRFVNTMTQALVNIVDAARKNQRDCKRREDSAANRSKHHHSDYGRKSGRGNGKDRLVRMDSDKLMRRVGSDRTVGRMDTMGRLESNSSLHDDPLTRQLYY
mmetsp:Transcript_15482/g.38149  ORF Transcript_15482/g.38149 Transcript_15482/m.38149 type:complete len:2315 (-) Transcript_15482:70-7014(-)